MRTMWAAEECACVLDANVKLLGIQRKVLIAHVGSDLEVSRVGAEVDDDSWSVLLLFFFSSRRRHTRLQGDWSSDVCSSDLSGCRRAASVPTFPACSSPGPALQSRPHDVKQLVEVDGQCGERRDRLPGQGLEIGRASCRERV